jgi:hypothetical protein
LRDRSDTGDRHQPLAQVVLGQLPRQFLFDLGDVLAQVLGMRLQSFGHLYQASRQRLFGQERR